LLLIGLGYAVVLTPWWLRNLGAFGSLWPPGGIRALWLTAYDELFLYPAGQLTADRWLQQGVAQLLEQRWEALLANLLSLGAVNGSVFLAPLMVSGLTGRAKSGVVSGMAAYLACLLVLMSLVFPFAGGRGGFFHSSAAAMPLMWAAAPQGLTRVLAWGERVRGWNRQLGWRLLGGAALAFADLLTAYVFRQRVVGPMPARPNWALSARTYAVLQSEFFSSLPEGRVAVNNPPGFYLATRREAIVIPDGGIDELAQAASAYGVRWVVLEANHPRGWNQFYSAPSSLPGLKWFATTSDEDGQAIYLLEFEAPMSGATP
jgi:hypothetical protein